MKKPTLMTKGKVTDLFYYLFGFRKISSRFQLAWVILIHIIGWLVFLCLPLLFYPLRLSSHLFLYKEAFDKLFLIAFFYFNHYYLIPRFFLKRKRTAYFLLVFACIILLLAQHFVVEKYFLHNYLRNGMLEPGFLERRKVSFFLDSIRARNIKPVPGFGPPPNGMNWQRGIQVAGLPLHLFIMLLRNVLSFSLMLTFISGFIYLFYSFVETLDEKKALENAKLKAEIYQLKSQINPHFLFNTLNSIYSLAHLDPEKTQQAVLKLSEIMRYMIYDATAENIPLEKDIHYLSSYIQLQRLRISDKVTINYEVTGNLNGINIAPMLLSTFVENAFKHGISYSNASLITIRIEVFDKTLTLFVSNPVVPVQKSETGGVGLQNAKRRLQLLYAGKYWLNIEQNKDLFAVNLKINLS